MFKKPVVKYFLQAGAIAIVGAVIFWGVGYYRMRTSPEYEQLQELKAMKERYMADTYGGNTPEETLQLFIDALKKGDIDLAAKYFVLDKQEEWRGNLIKVRGSNDLSAMIFDLQRERHKYAIGNDQISFDIANDDNEVALTISLGRGPNNLWKIIEL